jgi:hypothetical protein
MVTQLQPNQIKGLTEAHEDLEKLNRNTRGIKIATWVTAIATLILAIVGVVALIIPLLK